jgi:hypothetical protein
MVVYRKLVSPTLMRWELCYFSFDAPAWTYGARRGWHLRSMLANEGIDDEERGKGGLRTRDRSLEGIVFGGR